MRHGTKTADEGIDNGGVIVKCLRCHEVIWLKVDGHGCACMVEVDGGWYTSVGQSGLVVHWSGYVAVGCIWWRRLHSFSLHSTVTHHGVGNPCRVIQFGESEMPFVPLGTLLMHDKTLLSVLSEMDTEFTEIRSITDVQVAIEMLPSDVVTPSSSLDLYRLLTQPCMSL
jgi:hypothetical protein